MMEGEVSRVNAAVSSDTMHEDPAPPFTWKAARLHCNIFFNLLPCICHAASHFTSDQSKGVLRRIGGFFPPLMRGQTRGQRRGEMT